MAERGRPKKPPGERLDATVRVRFTPEEKARLQAAADAADKTLSEYARDVLLSSLRRQR